MRGAHLFEARTGLRPAYFYMGESETKDFIAYMNFCEMPYSNTPGRRIYEVKQVGQWMGMTPLAVDLGSHLSYGVEVKP